LPNPLRHLRLLLRCQPRGPSRMRTSKKSAYPLGVVAMYPSRAASADPSRKRSLPRHATCLPAPAPRPASAARRRHHGSAPQSAAAPSPNNPSA
jgi:hypothetical protein